MSDAAQQITPEALDKLLTSLDLQHECVASAEQLQDLRNLIDRLDNELINVLFLRSDVSKRIGAYKRAHALDIYQANRWSQIMENRRAVASEIGLDPDFVNVIYDAIHQHSLGVQNEIFTSAPASSKAVK